MNFFILLFIQCAAGANILYISLVASHSHHIWNSVLALALSKKGHNVTMVSHNKEESTPKNFHLIVLEGFYDKKFEDFSIDGSMKVNVLFGIKSFYDYSKLVCQHDFSTSGLTFLMDYPENFKFDLIVFDVTLAQCLYPLVDRFKNPPLVGVTPFLLSPALSYVFGNPLQTSYIPFYSASYTNHMTLLQRLANSVITYADLFYRKYIALPEEYELAKKYFGSHIRPLESIERNFSILLANTDPNLVYPTSLPPNIIPVGGMQVQQPKALPKDLQDIVTKATEGVVVFSLGSYLRSDQLSKAKRDIILSALAKLRQTVIWKFESDKLRNVPKNIIIRKWLPQSDLLSQPNAKLLINHGGALSSQEAIYHGVPIVSIPFLLDQFATAKLLESRNISRTVQYDTINVESFYETITEVLNDPMYRTNVKAASKRYNDKLNTPLETAVFWVEYILRHGSADHLNLAARDMAYYEILNLDVWAVLLLTAVLVYSLLSLFATVLKNVLKYILT